MPGRKATRLLLDARLRGDDGLQVRLHCAIANAMQSTITKINTR
jgi:hypothetical protein